MLLGIALAAVAQASSSAANGTAGKTWAVVIGISKYASNEVPSLEYAAADARLFSSFLISDEGLSIDASRVLTFLDDAATVSNLRSALGDFIPRNVGPDDTVIIFFAGHGGDEIDLFQSNKTSTVKYLLAYDTYPDRFYGTAISMTEDLGYLISDRIPSATVLCFLDCCHSGAAQADKSRNVRGRGIQKLQSFWPNVSFESPAMEIKSPNKKVMIATACAPHEAALELGRFKHGVFTWVSIEALAGKCDADEDGAITLGEYQDYVIRTVSRMTDSKQNPVIKASMDRTYLIAKAIGSQWEPDETTVNAPSWQQAQSGVLPAERKEILVEESNCLTQIKQEGDVLHIAVVSSPEKTNDMLDALADARRQQRLKLRDYLHLDSTEAEYVYDKGKVVDAGERDNGTWYLAMEYLLEREHDK